MAKVISDEILKLKIVINGDEAQKEVLRLERNNNKLAETINFLKEEQKELSATRKADAVRIKEINDLIKKHTDSIAENNRKIDEEIKGMNILSLTSDQLAKRIRDLSFQLKHMAPTGNEYAKAKAEMDQLTGRMNELRKGTTQSAFSLQNLSDKFNQYSGIATAAIATLAGVAFSIQGVIDANNKLADAQTAVSKTTGLSTEEVKELTRAYSEFDTRTKRIDLLKISEIGGRLGVPKEEIKEFTREVDKAYVALGDSFSGGVEAVAEKLGKIKGLFKETRDLSVADAINEVGSALNELGAAGAASEENMSDFALRVGQLPESLKPTIAETLALGGAFEESGITAERASSGYSKFVRVAATQTAEFAKVMGITQKEVKDLINQDPLQFFLKFAQGAKGLDATKLSEVLEGLKLNDAEVISVIGAASENTDRFTKSIELSNQALTDATSLQDEFNKVNNNSAAIYEKVQKKFAGMFTSESVAKTLNWLILTIGKLLGVVEDTTGKVTGVRDAFIVFLKIVTIAIVAVFSYNTAIALTNITLLTVKERLLAYTVVQKVNNFLTQAGTTIMTAYNAVLALGQLAYARLTGNTILQTKAQATLNLVTKANVFGALVAVVMAAVAAYLIFSKRTDTAAETQKKLNDITKEGIKNAASEISALEQTYKKLTDKNIAEKDRQRLLDEANKQYPGFFKNLTTEDFLLGKAKASYLQLRDAIIAVAQAKAAQSEIDKIVANYLEKEIDFRKKVAKIQEDIRNPKAGSYAGTGAGSGYNDLIDNNQKTYTAAEARENAKRRLKIELQVGKEMFAERNKALKPYLDFVSNAESKSGKLNNNNDSPPSNYKPLGGKSDKNNTGKSSKNNYDKELSEYEKSRQKLLEASANHNQRMEEYEADRLRALSDLQKDSYEKERQLAIAEEAKNVAELEKKKYSPKEFDQLRSMIAKEKGEMKKKLQEIEFQWMEENGRLSNLQEIEADKLNLKLLTINEKYLSKAFEQEQKAFEKKQRLLDRESNEKQSLDINGQKAFLAEQGYSPETLAGIRTWEESRAAIEKFYQEKRLREQVDYLKAMVAQMSVIQSQGLFDLTPEQLDQIQAMKDKIAALVAELAKLKNGDSDGDKLGGKLSSFGGNTDVLGLTPDQWEAMFTNTDKLSENIQKVGAALQVAKNTMGMYSQFTQANEEKLLQQYETASQRKTKLLDKQLKAGLINQEQYKKQTIANEKQLEKQKQLLALKAARRQRVMDISSAVSSTALAVVGALGNKPWTPFNFALAGLVGALGAVQIATIMSQPLPEAPGAEDGFYPVIRKQDNKLFQARKRRTSTGFYDEPTMLVGEQGAAFPELVVTQKTARQIDPDISNAYMREIARIEGYQDGYYKNVKTSQSSSTSSGDEIMIKLISTIDSFNETMQEIKTNGLETYIKDSLDNGAKIDKMVKGSQDLYNKNKHG